MSKTKKRTAHSPSAPVSRRLVNVHQATLAPLIRSTLALGTTVYTDEYAIYSRL